MAGYTCIVNGLWGVYPVFAQYKTPARCKTDFDFLESNLRYFTLNLRYHLLRSYHQINNLTTTLPCGDHNPDGKLDACSYCQFDIDNCAKFNDFEEIRSCLTQSKLTDNKWVSCSSYVYDKSLHPGGISWRGEEWNSVVSQFDWVCEKDLASFGCISFKIVFLNIFQSHALNFS